MVALFLGSFSCVCPEPVLVNIRLSAFKTRRKKEDVILPDVSRQSRSALPSPCLTKASPCAKHICFVNVVLFIYARPKPV